MKSILYTFFKIFLVVIGLFDIFNLLPQSLDIVDKGLAALILLIYWLALKPSKFIFGKEKKWLDYTLLGTFYILVIDTFVNLIRIIDLNDLAIKKISFFITAYLPGFLSNAIKSSFLFIHNPASTTAISLFSVYVGFSLIILIALYSAFRLEYGKKSVMHSITRVFIRKDATWKNFADTAGYSIIVKFFISLIVLFSVSQYFFALVNQWFIISLDKTLLVLAILFAVKDIQGTKSKALNKIGRFDEWLLGTITEVFTNEKKFFLGFGILLLFHYLSDLATFFLPYFFPFIGIDPFYLNYLGDTGALMHQPLSVLIGSEMVHSGFEMIAVMGVYLLSAIGIVLLILFPIVLIYFIIGDAKLSVFLKRKWHSVLLIIFFISMITFQLAPWLTQKAILGQGIQGVDFITHRISTEISITYVFIIVAIVFILSLFAFNIKVAKYFLGLIFIMSFVYLGEYVWNYFISSMYYHFGVIGYFFSIPNYYIGIMFIFLFILEVLFYLGGFLLLTYNAARIIVKDIIKSLITNKAIYAWTLALLLLPMLLMYNLTLQSFTKASIVIITLFIFSYSMYRELTGK